jgi:hypothetical protein
MNGRDAHGDQLELTPRIGLSEPLLRPEDAAELLSVRVSWIYEACRTGRLPCGQASAVHAFGARAVVVRAAVFGQAASDLSRLADMKPAFTSGAPGEALVRR